MRIEQAGIKMLYTLLFCGQADPLSWLPGTIDVMVFIASLLDIGAGVCIYDVLLCASKGWSMSSTGLEQFQSTLCAHILPINGLSFSMD